MDSFLDYNPQPNVPRDDKSREVRRNIFAMAVFMMVVLTILTGLRTWSRRLQRKAFVWGDVLMPASLLLQYAVCVIPIYTFEIQSFDLAFLKKYYEESYRKAGTQLLYVAFPCLYCVAVALPRLSLLDLYLQVFQDKWQRIGVYSVGVAIILNALVYFLITVLQCRPLHALWGDFLEGQCLDYVAYLKAGAIPNIVLDLFMILLPIPLVIKLKLSTRDKLGVSATFLTGSIGFAVSIARSVTLMKTDQRVDWTLTTIWMFTEPGAYHVAACLVTLKPLVIRLASTFSKLKGSQSNPRTSDGAVEPTPKSSVYATSSLAEP